MLGIHGLMAPIRRPAENVLSTGGVAYLQNSYTSKDAQLDAELLLSGAAGLQHGPRGKVALGEALRRARLAQKLSPTSLAKGASVSAASLSRVENGHMSPTSDIVVRVSDALGLSNAELLRIPNPRGGNHPTGTLAGIGRELETPQYRLEVLGSISLTAPFITLRAQILCPSMAALGDIHAHRGYEQIVVQTGTIALHLGAQAPRALCSSESVPFDSTLPHAVIAPRGPASILWIFAPGGRL